MQCSLFGPIAVARSLAVSRCITEGPLEKDDSYGSVTIALQQGVHLRRGDRLYPPLPERRVPALEAMVC